MKVNILAILLCSYTLTGISSHAQSCLQAPRQTIYFNKQTHQTRVRNIFITPQDSMFITGSVSTAYNGSNNTDFWVMLTNPGGTPVYSKAVGTDKNETVNGIRQTADGGYIIIGNTSKNSIYGEGWIAKLDRNCHTEWSVVIGGGYSSLAQVAILNNGDYAVSGVLYIKYAGNSNGTINSIDKSSNLVMRFNKDGKVLWWRAFHYTDREALRPIIQLHDNSLLVIGGSPKAESNIGFMVKMNQHNGSIIWMNEFKNPDDKTFPNPSEKSDGSIELHIGNINYNFDKNGKSTGGSIISLNANSALSEVSVAKFGSLAEGEDLYFANIASAPILFLVKDDAQVLWSRSYNPGNAKPITLRSGRIHNNNIYLTGVFGSDRLSDDKPSDEVSYIVQADLAGYTDCSDTFKLAFHIAQLPPQTNSTHSWADEGAVAPQSISLTTRDLVPAEIIDCGSPLCCKNTLVYKDTVACTGTQLQLPGGTVASHNGVYTSISAGPGGCDSAVYYNVNFVQPYPFTSLLGSDTCLVNNQPVTFSVANNPLLTYKWQNGSTALTYTASTSGMYYVTATAACNSFTDTIHVTSKCSYPVYVPSSFTPNNDGLNDVFRIPGSNGQSLMRLNIYNRYGSVIFSTTDAAKGWDGTVKGMLQPAGTYIYTIFYKDFAGNTHQLSGTLVLIK